MLRTYQRLFQLAVCAVAFSVVSIQASSATAQTGNWSYRPDLGGYLDVDTGLVWAERSFGIGSWNSTSQTSLPNLRASTGFPWRLPTVVESQTAAVHGIATTATILGTCWTSDAKNKGGAKTAHYAVNMYSGEAYLWGNGSLIHYIPVYRP